MEALLRRFKDLLVQWVIKYTGRADFTGSVEVCINNGKAGKVYLRHRVKG